MADLNLKFENGKAPALNADNMNKIVNEINRTNAKTKDLQSEIATLVIEKGGSIVQANPEEVPTEKITSIRINEDVFEMASETGIEVTQAEYDAMEAAGEIEADVNYFVKDATTSSDSFAEEISNIKTSLNELDNPTNKVIKLPNGTMIQSKVITFSSDVTKAWGSIFESQAQQSFGNWTEAFVETPIITTSVTNGNGWLETVSSTSRTYVGDCRMVRPTSATVSYTVNVIGIGRWK